MGKSCDALISFGSIEGAMIEGGRKRKRAGMHLIKRPRMACVVACGRMPSRKARDQREYGSFDSYSAHSSHIATRQAAAIQGLAQEIIAKRTKRHLDELEVRIRSSRLVASRDWYFTEI